MITQKVKIGGNNQLFVLLPKEWTTKNNVGVGDYVKVDIFNEPSIEILKKAKENDESVVLKINGNKTRRGKIKEFVADGVTLTSGLDSGYWVRFSDIRNISRSVKEVKDEREKNARVY